MFFLFVLCFLCLPSMMYSSMTMTREDCMDLYSMVRGQQSENAIDIVRKITSQGLDPDTIVGLYDYCLRSEEGIRYRRMAPSLALLNVQPHEKAHISDFKISLPTSTSTVSRSLYEKLGQHKTLSSDNKR